jgi:hypothetical protein
MEDNMFICEFCGEERKSKRSVSAHKPFCKSNPDRKDPAEWATCNRKGIPSWNSGLSGDPRCKHTEESRRVMSNRMKERTSEWHKENGKRISNSIKKKVQEGTWHTSLARDMHIEYKGIDLHGTWELKYAQYLDSVGISWIRNTDSFSYIFEGKDRKYTPDFYLPETDEYVEIKGYKTEKDESKWIQFPSHKKLKVLMKEQLQSLGISV